MKFHSLIAAALLYCAASSSHAALIHQFHLNGSLNDSVTGTSLVALGGTPGANAYVFNANQGLRLDAQLGGVYTIDMVFHFDSFRSYGRIVDFHNLNGDDGLYAAGHAMRLFNVAGTGAGGYLADDVNSRVTLTRDDQKMFRVYQNGELVLSVNDTTGIADFGQNVAHFFRDNVVGGASGEANPGAVDYIRVYNTALSAGEVRELAPPAAEVAEVREPASFGMVGAGLALLGWTRRRRK
ncbi:MAG: LamG-like jellyroll fold domain-containing protein [Telluria sp.]